MKGDKRRIKKIVTGLVILVLLGITLSGVRNPFGWSVQTRAEAVSK